MAYLNKTEWQTVREVVQFPVALKGELASRTVKCQARLEDNFFRPENLFGDRTRNHSWPGDWEGRALLAWVLLARSTGRAAGYLDEFMKRLYADRNSGGFLGRILPDGQFDEQQMAGHSWLLRGLIEYDRDHPGEPAADMIEDVVSHLYMPLIERIDQYPLERALSTEGEAAGDLSGACVNGYALSTDTGCLFIALDGLTAAYERKPEPSLKALLEKMIAQFAVMDLVAIQAQTHASLTAARGILRFYRSVKDSTYLRLAERIFSVYCQQGMTENYANYNWFGRPEWTEPCAIVDSFLLATQLWQLTGEREYLAMAHRIWLNAIGFAQRNNGGFGCDNCAGAQDVFLNVKSRDLYEAYWCCSMRGGEGLYAAASYGVLASDAAHILAFYQSGNFRTEDGVAWDITSQYPVTGDVALVCHAEKPIQKALWLYLPEYVDKATLEINGTVKRVTAESDGFVKLPLTLREGLSIRLQFEIPLCIEPTCRALSLRGYETYHHGYLLLGYVTTDGEEIVPDKATLQRTENGQYTDGIHILQPINDMVQTEKEQAIQEKRQILFAAQ